MFPVPIEEWLDSPTSWLPQAPADPPLTMREARPCGPAGKASELTWILEALPSPGVLCPKGKMRV